jgi:hypothetical protein
MLVTFGLMKVGCKKNRSVDSLTLKNMACKAFLAFIGIRVGGVDDAVIAKGKRRVG